jgi:hypothetical protein
MTKPKRLFRYFPPEASDVLAQQKLWFSAAKDFNDIFEVVPRYDRLLTQHIDKQTKIVFAFNPDNAPNDWAVYKKYMKPLEDRLYRESLETLPGAFQAKFSEHFGIVCFCGNGHSPLMWGHYTNCHQGFVVEFEPEHPLFATEGFGKVQYCHARPFVEEKDYAKILLTKSPEWDREEEYRLIKPYHELTKGKRRDGKEKHFIPLPSESIKAVYFGNRILCSARDELIESLASASYRHVKPYIMTLHDTDFTLVPLPWDQWKPASPDATADYSALWKSLGL